MQAARFIELNSISFHVCYNCVQMTKHLERHKRILHVEMLQIVPFGFLPTASDETKRKMYSSVLVVGGGLLFHGAQEFLQHRILNKMPPSFRRMVENVEVITRPKVSVWTVALFAMYNYSYTCRNCTEVLKLQGVLVLRW